MKRSWPAFISFAVLLVLIEILVRKEVLSASLVPAPSMVLLTMKELSSDFLQAFKETFSNVFVGWLLSLVSGTGLAFIFSLSDLLKRATLPFAVFFQTVPIIAIAPLLVIYFGFGAPTVIASSFIVSVFPVIANTLMGLESASEQQKDLFRLYKATSLQILMKLKIPCAYPYILSGLKISAGLSIVGAVAGEFVAGGGLGALIDSARTQQRVDMVFAALLLLSLMGLFFMAILSFMNSLIQKRRPL